MALAGNPQRTNPYHETRPGPFGPATDVGGTIITDTTWTKANSPYVVTSDVLVNSGITLTIEPGVTVQFGKDLGLYVSGTLLAAGTYTDNIHFTGTTPSAGWWADISLEGTSSLPNTGSIFSYVTVEYGGSRLDRPGNLFLFWASVHIDHSQFNHGFYNGIYGAAQGTADISESSFSDNGNGDTSEDYAVWFSDGAPNPSLGNLTLSGNSSNAVAFGRGTLTTRTWANAGAPYVITGDQTVPPGAILSIDSGVEVRFKQAAGLFVSGTLQSSGSAAQPVTLTGTSPTPGWWAGISILGDPAAPNEGSRLDYTLIAYGGSGAHPSDLYLFHAKAALFHSQLLNSSGAGLEASYSDGSVFEEGQITGNAGPGMQNDTDSLLIAPYNWWGSANGPTQTTCNPGGTGSAISGVVNFKPFLTSATQDPGPVPALSAPSLLIEPQRIFAPSDGVTRLWVNLTLHDVDGSPLPGRTLTFNSTFGSPSSGSQTDIQGKSYAYLTSSAPGDAILSATIGGIDPCEKPLASTSKVTFTSQPDSPYLPDLQAPYFSQALHFSPLPLITGVSATVSATLNNPNAFPILINGAFTYAQSNIGLVFGPISSITGFRIEANSQGTISTPWTPPVSGHICVRFDFSVTPALANQGAQIVADEPSTQQVNGDVLGDPASSPEEAGAVNELVKMGGLLRGEEFSLDLAKIPGGGAGYIYHKHVGQVKYEDIDFSNEDRIRRILMKDPPRQDYTIYAMPRDYIFQPVQTDVEISVARAAALNDLLRASLDLTSDLQAAELSSDRYQGAAAAGNLTWAAQQMAALLYYKKLSGAQMLVAANKIDALLAEIHTEGIQDMILSAATVRASQNEWATTGIPSDEILVDQSIGMSAAEIEAMRQDYIAADANLLAGSVLDHLSNLAAALRVLGSVYMNPPNFQIPGALAALGGQPRSPSALTPNQLGRFYQSTTTFQLGNPLTAFATITLSLRPLDLPPDWSVTVTPSSASLNPGQQTTITVTISEGSAVPQGIQPRLAVEGYANGQLIGGVVIDVLVPWQASFDGKLRVYLPVIVH